MVKDKFYSYFSKFFIKFNANATSGTNSRIALGGAPEGGNVTSAYMPDRFILDF